MVLMESMRLAVTVKVVSTVMSVTVTLFPSPPQSVKRGRW